MTEYTVQYHRRHNLFDARAQALDLEVRCDDAHFQDVEILVSALDLQNRWGIDSDHQRFWPAVMTVGLRAVRGALQRASIPTTTPHTPWTHYVNRSDVDRIIGSDAELPALDEDTEVARFTV
jgi:hypothetical protein